ncbi:MAG: prephenate dehydrogenase/arogenate dehydrogenase family protein [bacterium]
MRIAIIGLGLIGGSIGLGLKQLLLTSRLAPVVVGIPRQEETIGQAISRGAIDEGTTDLIKGVTDADLVFICTPINLIIPTLEKIVPVLKKGAIVTDVGSSKHEIVSQADKLMPKGTYFVAGHPLAGKEKAKLGAAEAKLFDGKTWVLTPTARTSKKALAKIADIIRMVGGLPLELDPKLHDLVVAGISHVPLAVAAALVNTVADTEEGQAEMKKLAASGFRDTTRIASGDPILGVDMFTTNKKAVLKMIKAFKKSLGNLEKLIKEGGQEKIKQELSKAKLLRDSIFS